MGTTARTRTGSVAARRVGYALAAGINMAIIYGIHVWPGWRQVSILTDDTTQVLGLLTLSLVASVVANVVYLVSDRPPVKAVGELVTTGIGIAVLLRIWQVFPFDFSAYEFNWPFVVRLVLVVAIVGAALGALIQLVSLIRSMS
jgi:hypothetical protein